MEFSFIGTQVPQTNAYDNKGAHDQIKSMMQRKETLSIKFFTTRDHYPSVWIESAKVLGFKYLSNNNNLIWLFNYLREGKIEDFEVNPLDVESFKEDEDNDIQLVILKQLIESGIKVQFTPLFRETNNFISAVSSFPHGKIFFRVERTEELLDYLREKGALI
jgi:hypothetical protein